MDETSVVNVWPLVTRPASISPHPEKQDVDGWLFQFTFAAVQLELIIDKLMGQPRFRQRLVLAS